MKFILLNSYLIISILNISLLPSIAHRTSDFDRTVPHSTHFDHNSVSHFDHIAGPSFGFRHILLTDRFGCCRKFRCTVCLCRTIARSGFPVTGPWNRL